LSVPDSQWRPAPRTERDALEEEIFEQLEDLQEPPAEREGLPSTYRMRHDAHYVDHLIRPAQPSVQLLAVSDIHHAPATGAPELAALTTSIARFGLLQPLLVRRHNGRYEVIAGKRRLAAAVAAGLAEVPCVVHDADESRARALAEATNVRPGRADGLTAGAATRAGLSVTGLAGLTDHLEAIGSCLSLFARRDRPLRERIAKDLIEAEVQRAARLAQGLAVLTEDPVLACRPVDVGAVLRQAIDRLQPEQVLANVGTLLEVKDGPVQAWADDRLLSLAVSGALAAMHALVEQVAAGAVLHVTVSSDPGIGMAVVEITERAVMLPASRLARFFDPSWLDRPGGAGTAIGAVAAWRIVTLHAGRASVAAAAGGGCTLRLEFPGDQRDG